MNALRVHTHNITVLHKLKRTVSTDYCIVYRRPTNRLYYNQPTAYRKVTDRLSQSNRPSCADSPYLPPYPLPIAVPTNQPTAYHGIYQPTNRISPYLPTNEPIIALPTDDPTVHCRIIYLPAHLISKYETSSSLCGLLIEPIKIMIHITHTYIREQQG